ncbi:MAG: dihydroorotate dehydrogenase electron transfer subunit, partial [Candidatus Omnitrophota bacterium]
MKELNVKIGVIEKINPHTYRIGFKSPYLAQKAKPAQFLHIKIDNKVTLLRRPFSIHKIKADTVYVLFKVRGRGTHLLSQYKRGDVLDLIGPLGNGFKYELRAKSDEWRILVAGGIGVAPLLFLGETIRKFQSPNSKSQTIVLLGAKTKNEILCGQDFQRLGYKVRIATEDGSRGYK